MTLYELIEESVFSISKKLNCPFTGLEPEKGFILYTNYGLCLIGYSDTYAEERYFDVRWRIYLGEATDSFNMKKALQANHKFPDSPYGLVTLEGRDIISNTDTYRFLFEWSGDKIHNIILARFGSAFIPPLMPSGVQKLSDDFYRGLVQKYGFNGLLGYLD